MSAVLSACWRSFFALTLIVAFFFVTVVLGRLSPRIGVSGPAMCSYVTELHDYLICRSAAAPYSNQRSTEVEQPRTER